MEITLYKNFSACVTSCVVCMLILMPEQSFLVKCDSRTRKGSWTTGCQHKFSSTLHYFFGYFFFRLLARLA